MEVRLIDRHRNVTLAPKPPYVAALRGVEGSPLAALDALLERAGNVSGGQHEFEVDREFAAALKGEKRDGLDVPDKPWREGHEATYRGVPVIVQSARSAA